MRPEVVDRIVRRFVAAGLIPDTAEARSYAAEIIKSETRKRIRLVAKRTALKAVDAMYAHHSN